MAKFYGKRTCTLEFLPDSYHNITHTTIATMRDEEDILQEIDTLQISTCHRTDTHLSVSKHENYYSNSTATNIYYYLKSQCYSDQIITKEYEYQLKTYLLNFPIMKVKNFLSKYATPIGITHYTGKKHIIINTIRLEREFINA